MSAQLTVRIPIKDRNGNVVDEKEVATYAGLLAKAHEEGLRRIETTLVQTPSPDNGDTAIVLATVETERGVFTGIGDAHPGNVNRKIVPHIIRMAETRSKARALRDAVNIGIVALEELGGDDQAFNERQPSNVRPFQPSRGQQSRGGQRPGQNRRPLPRGNSRGSDTMSEAQSRLLYRILSERGYEGDDATNFLLQRAGVERLGDVLKRVASQMIDELRAEEQRGA